MSFGGVFLAQLFAFFVLLCKRMLTDLFPRKIPFKLASSPQASLRRDNPSFEDSETLLNELDDALAQCSEYINHELRRCNDYVDVSFLESEAQFDSLRKNVPSAHQERT
jgi:hypothetical protein